VSIVEQTKYVTCSVMLRSRQNCYIHTEYETTFQYISWPFCNYAKKQISQLHYIHYTCIFTIIVILHVTQSYSQTVISQNKIIQVKMHQI